MQKILLLFIPIFTFLGCTSKKVEPVKNNEIFFNSVAYNIGKGQIENYGMSDDGGYNMDLTLYSNGVSPIEEDGGVVAYSGQGNFLYLQIFSPKAGELPVGSYNFNSAQVGNTFDDGILGLNVNFDTGDGEGSYIVSGSVKVISITNGVYEMQMSLVNEDDVAFTVYYKGKLTQYDYASIPSPLNAKASASKKQRPTFF